jgi:SAM-dependent methyltransferase
VALMQSRTDGQALSAADLCLVDRQMTHPLWAAVPHGWRWKWLDRDARAAQVEFDARANARRYDGIAADPAAFDDVALDAIGHYLLPGRVLDVGAGTGTYTAHLPGTRFANEPVDAAWAVLCASVPGVQRVGGDAYGLDAPSESFHIVTAARPTTSARAASCAGSRPTRA